MASTASSFAPTPVRLYSLRTKLLWIAALYFASGFPYGLITELLPVYFRQRGVSLTEIGLMSVVALPWTFKFLWAPLVDRFADYKRWIVACQIGLALVTVLLLLTDPGRTAPLLWIALVSLATLSATQDIAVDANSIQLLERSELGAANGVRVSAYRIAMLVAGGVLLTLAGFIGWPPVFIVASGTMLAAAAVSAFVPATPRAERTRSPEREALRELLIMPVALAALVFVLTFKLGDVALTPMTKPFWVDAGYSTTTIGAATTAGIAAAITGALLGGFLTTRWGIFQALWVLGLVQALSNLGYFAAARMDAAPHVIYATIVLEQLTAGLGTAAFLAFLMSLCSKAYAATQYALLSALFRLGGTLAGIISGALTQRIGYSSYFLITFLLALPAFALLPFVRRVLEARNSG